MLVKTGPPIDTS